MLDRLQAFIRGIRTLRQAATLPEGERAQALMAARAGLTEWSAEVMVPRMIHELEHGSEDLQRAAISALRNAGLDAVEAVPALMAFFEAANPKDSDTRTYARKEAAYAAEEILRLSRQFLASREREEAERVREQARAEQRAALEESERASEQEFARTLDELATAAFDENPQVREAAIEALHELDGPYELIAPVIRTRLRDEDPQVREAAARLLGQWRP